MKHTLIGIFCLLLFVSSIEAQSNERIEEARQTRATVLRLNGLDLSELPPELFELTWLEGLDLGFNNLTELPNEIAQLTNLQWLNLNGNRLTDLPCSITTLPLLSDLNVRSNPLQNYPDDFVTMNTIQMYEIVRQKCLEIALQRIQQVRVEHSTQLDLSNLELWQVPPELYELTWLETLNYEGNRSWGFTPDIQKLSSLKELRLNLFASHYPYQPIRCYVMDWIESGDIDVVITALPNYTGWTPEHLLSQSRMLCAANNEIYGESYVAATQAFVQSEVDSCIGDTDKFIFETDNLHEQQNILANICRSTTYIEVTSANLAEIPPSWFILPNVESVVLTGNDLTTLPPQIVQWRNLTYLGLVGNDLKYLPYEIALLPNLQTLELAGNPIIDPPHEIISQGVPAIQSYLREKRARRIQTAVLGSAGFVGLFAMIALLWRRRQFGGRKKKNTA